MFNAPERDGHVSRARQQRAYELAEVVRQARAHFPMFGRPTDNELRVIVANTAKKLQATRLNSMTMAETAMVMAALRG